MTPAESTPTVTENGQPRLEPRKATVAEPLRLRYRVRFAKTGLLRWTSHRDLARLWERLVRRAQLKLSMTEGFHPKPRIGFPSALALGISGINEVVELDLAERLTATELFRRLTQDDQPGLMIKSVQLLPEGSGKAKLDRTDYLITTPDPDLGAATVDGSAIRSAIDSLLAKETVTVTRKNKPVTFRVADQIISLKFDSDIELSMAASDRGNIEADRCPGFDRMF